MSATDPADEYEALVHVVERVALKFPSIPEDELLDLVADELTRFDRARVRAYIPVLVEGNVLRRLRASGASPTRLAS